MNRSKRLGTSFETDCVTFLKANGYPDAERRALEGQNDRGDIAGTPYVFECKNLKSIDLATGLTELSREITNAGVRWGFLLTKRRNRSTRDAYVTMPFSQLVELLKEVERGR
jgi:hypothetical protein